VLCAGAFALHPTHASTRFAVPNRVGDTSGGQLMTATSGTQPATAVSGEQVVTGTSGKWLMTATSRQQVTAAGLLRLVWVPVLAMLLMGAFFAAVQSTLTMYATAAGRPAAAGLIYALMAVGSAGTALGTAVLPERIGPALRCAGCAIGLSLGVLLIWTTIAVSGSLVWLCGAVLLTGLWPALVCRCGAARRRCRFCRPVPLSGSPWARRVRVRWPMPSAEGVR
jgi:hypothetical protein